MPLYTGEQWDPDLGYYYLRARYSNPETGRFWTMDSYQGENQNPLTLHKYLLCVQDPINRIDPSGHLSLADSAKYGQMVHTMIGKHFVREMKPFGISGQSISTILNLPNTVVALLPDLVDVRPGAKEIYEIKPTKSLLLGIAQINMYLNALNYFDPTGNWHVGSLYMPPAQLTLDLLTIAIIDPVPIDGVILYELFSVKDFAKKRAVNVAQSQANDVDDSVGMSTLTGMIGGAFF